VAWVAALTNTPAEVIAIDGKTSRRSYQNKGSKEAIHIVSMPRSVATPLACILAMMRANPAALASEGAVRTFSEATRAFVVRAARGLAARVTRAAQPKSL
jgi:hypothetical protein